MAVYLITSTVFGSRGALSFTDDLLNGAFQSALMFEQYVIQHAQWPGLKNIKKYSLVFVIIIFNIDESSAEDYYDYQLI